MAYTYTRTHVHIEFANPYLICEGCKEPVTAWHDPERCGCENTGTGWYNIPCTHNDAIRSVCYSWGPVDDCICASRNMKHESETS